MIGCDCAVCHSPDPRDNRTRSSIYITTPECAFVVDTGTDFRTQVLRENILHLDAVIFTHSHTDHVMGFDDLRRFGRARGGTMPVYASAETMADLERFRLGETTITPLPVPHGNFEVNGYLFSRAENKLLAYLCDCSAVPDEIARKIEGVQVLIIDALRHKPHPTHLSVDQALQVASNVRAGETYFTHICHELPQAAEAELPPHAYIAYDGLRLNF